MIIDRIENCKKYEALLPGLAEMFEALTALNGETPVGQIKLSGENFINVASYDTNVLAKSRYEGHFVYADVQYMIDGVELIDIAPDSDLAITEDGRPSDYVFYEDPKHFTRVTLTPGTFALILPGEAHRPSLAVNDTPSHVFKAVGKVRLS